MARLIRKAVSPVVGLGAEAIAHHKNKKQESPYTEAEHPQGQPGPAGSHSAGHHDGYEHFDQNPPPNEPAADAESDEEDWQADEAAPPPQRMSCVPKDRATGPASINDIVSAFLSTYPARPNGNALPCPVVIPQKRPGNKTRGFVHAYAPALEAIGIDEHTWMDFMNCFEESIRVSGLFNAVNIAVNVVGTVGMAFPSVALQATTTAITAADMTAQRMYQRSRYNDFLAQLNEKYFKQFGLYALIMTYDPSSSIASQPFDLSGAVAKAEHGADATGMKAKWKTLKGVTGTTHGPNQMPQAAELVFPAIDKPEGEGWWKRSNRFIGDYMDKRAQAHYNSTNPDAPQSLKTTTPQFESSHGAMGTSSLSIMERRRRRMDAYHDGGARAYGQQTRQQFKPGQTTAQPPPAVPGKGTRRSGPRGGPISLMVTKASGGKLQGKDAHPIAIVRRTLKPGMMYLMVTQLPSPEQLAAAREMMELE